MIRIAVLGDIGSGKSYIAKQFSCPVFCADLEVNKLYKKSKKCFQKLKKTLPKYVFSFPIRKKEISKAIIDNKNNIKKVIKIIHPEIRARMNNFIRKNKNKKIVVLDIPLLLESKINKKSDILVFVEAKKKLIEKRLKKRGNFHIEILKKLKKFQLPVEFKKRRSDFIIKNNFNKNYAKKSVKKILERILLDA